MKKKVFVCVMLIVMATMAWAGGDRDGGSDRTQLTIWQLNNRQPALDVLVGEYESRANIRIVPSYFDVDGIKDAKKVAAASRTLPDMWFNWGGSLGGFYAENNLLYDLTDYARANNWDRIFSPGALNLATLHGQLAGYPISYNALAVYYRRDIFNRFNLRAPTTFEEFERVCSVLRENGIIPIATAGQFGWHVMRFVELLIEHYAGATLHDQMSTFMTSYNNDAVVRALTKYKEFVDRNFLPPGFVTLSPGDTSILLFSGQAAMDIQGQWYDGNIIRDEQNMDNFGTFAFPSGGNNRLSAFVEMTQFNANLSPERLEQCIQFKHFYFSNENAERFSQHFNLPLPRLDAQMPRGMPNVSDILTTANRNGTFTITDQAFPTEVADELFRVQDGIALNQVTPQQGAARIQAAIEAYLRSN